MPRADSAGNEHGRSRFLGRARGAVVVQVPGGRSLGMTECHVDAEVRDETEQWIGASVAVQAVEASRSL